MDTLLIVVPAIVTIAGFFIVIYNRLTKRSRNISSGMCGSISHASTPTGKRSGGSGGGGGW